ncbi:MAG: hypothetical protein WAX79_01245 [Candidatus Omnitrophota bacterium]
MKEHLGFLKTSSAVVKVAAWIFLFLGVVGSVYIFLGRVPGRANIDGLINLAICIFLFFFLFVIAKIADLLVKIINEIHEIKKE